MNDHFEAADFSAAARDSAPLTHDSPKPANDCVPPAVERPQTAPRDILPTFARILQRMEPHADFPALRPETRMEELGIDSVATMEILGCLEDEFDVVIPDDVLMSIRTVGDIERAMNAATGLPGRPD